MAENFFSTLEYEFIDRRVFRTQSEVRMANFGLTEGRYAQRQSHLPVATIGFADSGPDCGVGY